MLTCSHQYIREKLEEAAQYLLGNLSGWGALNLSGLQQDSEQAVSEQGILWEPLGFSVKVPQEWSQHGYIQWLISSTLEKYIQSLKII